METISFEEFCLDTNNKIKYSEFLSERWLEHNKNIEFDFYVSQYEKFLNRNLT